MTFPDFGSADPLMPMPPPPRIASALADAMVQMNAEGSVMRRWAIVTAVNGNGTLNINIGGIDVPNIPRSVMYQPIIGERVQVDVIGTDMVVVGPTAPSPRNVFINQRLGVVTGIASNGTLTINIDGQAYSGIPRLLTYWPMLGDTVRVLQDGTTLTFLCLGPVAGSAAGQRQPTGNIEMTMMKVAKQNTVILNGNTLSRSVFSALFQWVVDQGLIGAGLPFGVGDNSTTFQLPDMRGRVPVGVGTLGADTYALAGVGGATLRSLLIANMPAHKHNVSVANHANHYHPLTGGSGDANGSGDHGGHFDGTQYVAAAGSSWGLAAWNSPGSTRGYHSHSVNTEVFSDPVSISAHSVTESTIGNVTPDPFDIRQPYIGVNWLMWV